MQTIKLYLYPNSVQVQVFDPGIFTVRNRIVYSRPIKVYQGIDNPVQVVVKNQDQKPVNLTGYSMQAQIQDPVNQVTINTYSVTFSDITKGIGICRLDATTLSSLEQRVYKLTFRTIKDSDNSQQPIYVDDNYGIPLDLEILPAYYSITEAIPSINDTVFDGGTI